ncbi:hypothetical protein TRICI_004652 [Trichomonascus ciferrii]|uniref:NADH:flavin oxidoreductase/NADH oxidase N-terminal domain-containing protein n=1 Tax=Trichomonascus ciferrii TaxID=44093 RepID=A0A642UZS7_9ASCO|nr:hypothetical protein TRICI_004652 [Trichomonascus ciferrii]
MTRTENPNVIDAAPGVEYFTPLQDPPAGTFLGTLNGTKKEVPRAFQPLTIRGQTFQNRIWVSPMCQYSYRDGFINDWTLVQIGSYATRGASLSMIEASGVAPEGRISPNCAGIWKDEHVPGLKRVADFVHSQGQRIGIQLAHAGRKGSTTAPWTPDNYAQPGEEGGYQTVAPSPLKYAENFADPKELTKDEISEKVEQFKQAAIRAVKAGIDVIEIHGAHGYLVNEFLSPISNQRTDEYGGSFENRIRFVTEIVKAVKTVVPEHVLLFIRISATDRLDHLNKGFTVKDSIKLLKVLKGLGIDVVDVSSGGNSPEEKIKHVRGFHGPFAYEIKEAIPDLAVGTVGAIHSPKTIADVLGHGIDAVFVARPFLQNPSFIFELAHKLGIKVQWPIQMGYTNKHPLPLDDEAEYINE